MSQSVIFTHDIDAAIEQVYSAGGYDRCFVLCDAMSAEYALPLFSTPLVATSCTITIPSGDEYKSVDTLSQVWLQLSRAGATRKSLLINIGGGMVTDLGGFVAATFKRGIDCVNVPTTLLGAVDAAVGGKTGINFGGLKNEIGAFYKAQAVIVSTRFYATLPREEFLAGYAEMLKHALIDGDSHYNAIFGYDITLHDADALLSLLQHSVAVKQAIVAQDPQEAGLRKVLNLGHTVAHALESHALKRGMPIRHGYAVAWGIVCELLMSHRALQFPSAIIYDLARRVEQYYGAYAITCDDYDELIGYMLHDKKNEGAGINFTLLQAIGVYKINEVVSQEEIKIAFDFYRDLFHL